MERLKRSFRNSFRRKKSIHQTESSKPHQWEGDEKAVRNGNCSFHVKYLGCVQVEDSRGMHICEHALLTLKSQKSKALKGQLYVSGDGLRVVDDETKGLIVDQTIEKVSFCAPDRNHERGFSYICRDGTTRRWMCHGFLATKDTGDRLSHAVGCAFSVCLERKQKRDSKLADSKNIKNNINKNNSLNSVGSSLNSSLNTEVDKNSTKNFNRTGSFRRIPLVQRMKDPQECKTIEPLPIKEVHNPYAIERPHATPQLLERQGSCRIFKGLNQNSPFKRQLSLRLTTPSQLEKQRRNSLQQQNQELKINKFGTLGFPANDNIENKANQINKNIDNSISNDNKQKNDDDLSAMCKYMVEGLSILSNKNDLFNDNFISDNSNCIDNSKKSEKNLDLLNEDNFFKTIINIDEDINKSKTNNENDSFETINKKNQENLKDNLKFGKLVSYSDDFFQNNQKVLDNKTFNSSKKDGLLFTDLDEPFETNFDNNLIENQIESISNNLKNSPLRSLSNSHNSDINKLSHSNKKQNTLNKKSLENNFNNDFTENLNNFNNNNISMTKNNKLKYQKDLFDPFDSEWVSLASRHKNDVNRNTNPFLQTAVKAFELKM